MIYHLFQYLEKSGVDFPGIGLMHYLSVRAMLASIVAVVFALIFGKWFINKLSGKKYIQEGERIYDTQTAGQEKKNKTPGFGGVIFILGILCGTLLFADLTNIYIILLVFSMLWCGALGFADDYIKSVKKNKDGLPGKAKLLGQVILGFVVGLTVWMSPDIVVREKVEGPRQQEEVVTSGKYAHEDVVKSKKTTLPFIKNHEFNYKWLTPFKGRWGWYTKWAIYVFVIIFIITACSNGVNLTDGIDGLAGGTSAIVGVVLGILAWLSGNLINSNYLNIMYLPGSGEISVFMAAMVGALIGFLWYNCFPADIFMGDTGSLSLGGIIGVSAVLLRKELLLPVLCGIFFMESLSVILQTGYCKLYKRRHNGEPGRIWSRAPLHHHYQKNSIPEGYIKYPKPNPPHHEARITVRFWIVGILLAVSTLALLKIR